MTAPEIAAYASLPGWVIRFAQDCGELPRVNCERAEVDGWLRFRARRAAAIELQTLRGESIRYEPAPVRSDRGYVYFYATADMLTVKIGWSLDPVRRLRVLQTSHAAALGVLGVVPGTRGDEAAWHRRWQTLRVRGEWFRLTPELRDAVVAATGAAVRTAIDSQTDSP